MYKLYNVKRWGSMAPHFVLEELGVPYHNIWMTPEQVRSEEFRRLSPLGFIPALGLDDGRVIVESMAIVAFLTDANPGKGLAPRAGSADAAVYLSTLALMSSNIYAMINFAEFVEDFTADASAQQTIRDNAIASYQRVFDILDARLSKEGPFLLGETFSAADLYLFMLTIWAKPSEQALHNRCRAIARLCDHVRQRPKLKAALETHGVVKPAAAAP
jgi:glutathione S-transferase